MKTQSGCYGLDLFCFVDTGDGTQGLMFARQTLYQLSYAPSPLLFREGLMLLPSWPQTSVLVPQLPKYPSTLTSQVAEITSTYHHTWPGFVVSQKLVC
jgi:hypothetical protein